MLTSRPSPSATLLLIGFRSSATPVQCPTPPLRITGAKTSSREPNRPRRPTTTSYLTRMSQACRISAGIIMTQLPISGRPSSLSLSRCALNKRWRKVHRLKRTIMKLTSSRTAQKVPKFSARARLESSYLIKASTPISTCNRTKETLCSHSSMRNRSRMNLTLCIPMAQMTRLPLFRTSMEMGLRRSTGLLRNGLTPRSRASLDQGKSMATSAQDHSASMKAKASPTRTKVVSLAPTT